MYSPKRCIDQFIERVSQGVHTEKGDLHTSMEWIGYYHILCNRYQQVLIYPLNHIWSAGTEQVNYQLKAIVLTIVPT